MSHGLTLSLVFARIEPSVWVRCYVKAKPFFFLIAYFIINNNECHCTLFQNRVNLPKEINVGDLGSLRVLRHYAFNSFPFRIGVL